MKRASIIAGLILITTISYSQKTFDALFEKYGNTEGFVTVTISGDILKLASSFDDDENNDLGFLPEKITSIRILAQEDEDMKVENFYDIAVRDLDLKNYEEFMRIKESGQDLRILVRTEGTHIKEFLMIAGGKDNALIQITGDITRAEAKRISEQARKNNSLSLLSESR